MHLAAAPRVSVLMTVYNAAPFLRESIESILAQTFGDWELVIVDDGSTDASAAMLSGYTDPRLHVFTFARNTGRTPALRHALAHARGEYIAVLDADDIAYPDRLRRETEFMDAHSRVVLVGSWVRYIDRHGEPAGAWTPPPDGLYDQLGARNVIVHSSVMYRRKAAEDAGGYAQPYQYAQDFALILALAGRGEIAMIPEYLGALRFLEGSMTRSRTYRLAVVAEEFELIRRAGKVLPLSIRGVAMNRGAAARCEFRHGREIFWHGKVWDGLGTMALGMVHFLTQGNVNSTAR